MGDPSTAIKQWDGISAAAATQRDRAIALRRRLHRHPELGLELPETQRAVLDALEGLPLDVRIGKELSSVVAVLDGGRPGKTVLLRADMDALPMPEDTGLEFASEISGRMHACGHDAHVAMLAGAARVLAAQRDSFAGRVVLMFQPGEEGFGGAAKMIAEGMIDDLRPDAAFALHIAPHWPVGTVSTRGGAILASADEFKITLRGRGGHASMPHDAIDPIPIACEIVQAIQTFVTRRVNVFDPAVVTVGRITAGTTYNVIPEDATLIGTIRTVSEPTRVHVREGVKALAEGIAAAHGATATTAFVIGYPPTINDPEMARFARGVAAELLGEGAVRDMPSPLMGAEDFSFVLDRVPGAMLFLGVAPEDRSRVAPCHSNRMILNEDALTTGIALHTALALRFLGSE